MFILEIDPLHLVNLSSARYQYSPYLGLRLTVGHQEFAAHLVHGVGHRGDRVAAAQVEVESTV